MAESKKPVEDWLFNNTSKRWCPEAESNHRHADFQSAALPTELSGRNVNGAAYPSRTDDLLITSQLLYQLS